MEFLPKSDESARRLILQWVLGFFVLSLSIQIWRIFSLNATYDQGLFLQEIWNGLNGNMFESTLASEISAPVIARETLPQVGYSHLGHHFTPLLILWVPIVWALGEWSLPIIQVGLISFAGLVLYFLAEEYLPKKLAGWIACSFFTTSTVIGPTLENFHDLCIVPLLAFTLLLGISRENKLLYIIPAFLLPLVREDVGLLTFGFGIWMVLRRPNWRLLGFGLCIYSVFTVVITTNLIMPIFGTTQSEVHMNMRFGQFLVGNEKGTVDVLISMLKNPYLLLRELITPPIKTLLFIITFALPLGLISLFSIDSWILTFIPLFVAMSSQGSNALSVTLRFALFLVPGTFSGSIFWWSKNILLFKSENFRKFWRSCILVAISFALISNPHRSLSAIIPDSINPWVHIPINQQWDRGLSARKIISTIPKDASVAAETQLIPKLARRKVLIRFPFHYQYIDESGVTRNVDLIVSQLRFNALYASGFKSNRRVMEEGNEVMRKLVESGEYGVRSCDKNAIVLENSLSSDRNLKECFLKEIYESERFVKEVKN